MEKSKELREKDRCFPWAVGSVFCEIYTIYILLVNLLKIINFIASI